MSQEPNDQAGALAEPLDALFGGVGFVAGLAAAIYGYTLFFSLALALFWAPTWWGMPCQT